MSVVVVGVEHRRAPLDLLERATVADDDVAKVLGTLRGRQNLAEAVVLSTCLRTEIYAVVDRFHDAVAELTEVLADQSGHPAAELEPFLSVRFDDDVATHLFSVASGLESAVPGEGEVLGQVRRAWERARGEGVSGPVLAGLFRHATETGKRARTETAIARGTTSFSHAALDLAGRRLGGGLEGTAVVVLGAGEMGAGLVGALLRRATGRPSSVTVLNRTPARAAEVVARIPAAGAGDAGPTEVATGGLDRLAASLAGADLVVVAVEGDDHVLGPDHLAARPPGRPLLVVDLGVPRNVDPAVRQVDGVTVCDLDDLRASVDAAMEGRYEEVAAARAIVTEEVARYRAASRARVAAPVIAALRSRLDDIRRAEVARHTAGLDEAARARVDAATRAALAKLLHEPTVLLKETAGTPRGERLVEALRTLFDL